jgi:hypothetical protein
MRISQYVYFSISSETVPAATVAAHLGMGEEFLVWDKVSSAAGSGTSLLEGLFA